MGIPTMGHGTTLNVNVRGTYEEIQSWCYLVRDLCERGGMMEWFTYLGLVLLLLWLIFW